MLLLLPQKLTYPTFGKRKKSSSKMPIKGGYLSFIEGSRLWGHCAGSRDPSNFHRNRIFSILRRSGFFSPAGNLVVSVLWGGRGPVCCVCTTGIQTEASRDVDTSCNQKKIVTQVEEFFRVTKMLSIYFFRTQMLPLHGTGIFTKPFPLVHVAVFHL